MNKMLGQHKKINSNTGEEIFNTLLTALNQNADAVIELFHEDVIVEFPYASSLGTTDRMNFEEWYNYLKGGLPSMPDITYNNIKVYQVDENTYWSEASGETIVPSTGQTYVQNWVMYFKLTGRKIIQYREYWDPYAVIKAFGNGDEEAVKAIFNTSNR